MKVLGRGWQYTVYDTRDGRVLKKYHGLFLSYFQVVRYSYNYPNFSFFNVTKVVKDMKYKAEQSISFLKQNNFDSKLFGNPTFLDSVNYSQDKIRTIQSALINESPEEAKCIIDSFVSFQKKIIKLGFIDKSFNLCKNFGVTHTREIVLLDLGELFFEDVKIKEQITCRAWSKKYVIECLPTQELKEYFLVKMNKEITINLVSYDKV